MQTDDAQTQTRTAYSKVSASTVFAPPVLERSHLQKMGQPFDWNLPDNLNIGYLICGRWAETQPQRDALLHLDAAHQLQKWSYGELDDAARRLATGFKQLGLKAGDRIALMLPQAPETIISHVASAYCETIALPLFSLFGQEALRFRLHDSATSCVVTDADGLAKLTPILDRCPAIKHILLISSDEGENSTADSEHRQVPVHDFHRFIAEQEALAEYPQTHKDTPAVMIYTSGTTGSAKGAVHAHRFLIGHLPNIEISHHGLPQPDDVAWTPADWAWIGGLMDLAMPALFYGVPLIAYRMRKFDPAEAFKLIADFQIKNMFLPPTALKLMYNYALENQLPPNLNIRSVASGGEALPAALTHWARTELGVMINEIYGQTECNLVICTNRAHEPCPDGFMGRAVTGHELAILDADAQPLPADTVGQIAVRAAHPVTFLGYWQQPEKTAEKFAGKWLLTGDLGLCDAQGNFKFISRDDDVISSAGYRIGPTEIENCLLSHPSVSNAAVIGLDDELRGQAITAILIASSEHKTDAEQQAVEQALIDQVRTQLSPHMVPRHLFWAEELPMTTTGKIMRNQLRHIYQQKLNNSDKMTGNNR